MSRECSLSFFDTSVGPGGNLSRASKARCWSDYFLLSPTYNTVPRTTGNEARRNKQRPSVPILAPSRAMERY